MSVIEVVFSGVVALALVIGGTALICVLPVPEKSLVRVSFILSFLASLVILCAYWKISAVWGSGRQGFSYSDDEGYHLTGQMMAAADDVFSSDDRNPGFPVWTAMLYKVAGPNTIIVRIFNILFHCLWVVPVAFMADVYRDSRTTRMAILLTAWAPSALITSVLHLKDLLAALALLSALAAIVYIKRSRVSMIFLIASSAVLWFVRKDLLLVLGAVACAYAVHSMFRRKLGLRGITVYAALAVFGWFGVSELIQSWGATSTDINVYTQILEYTNQNAAGAHGLAPFFIKSPGELWKLPFTMATVMIMPFPPTVNSDSIFEVVNSFSSLFILFLMPFTIVGCTGSIKTLTAEKIPALVAFLCSAALLALVFCGTPRYREQIIGLFCLFAAFGITTRKSHPVLIRGSVLGLFSVLAIGTITYLFVS